VLALAVMALAPAPSYARSGPLGGVNILSLGPGSTTTEADQAIALAHRLHASLVRTQIPWAVFEPQGPGLIDAHAQAFTDRLVADASAVGIRVIMSVDGTPCWASTAPAAIARKCSAARLTAANAWPPAHPNDYGAFLAYLAARYGTQLAALEVWNEPDQSNEAYLAGPQKPQHYADLLRAAYPAVKHADPQVTVLGGSLVGSNGDFLRALYAAGIKGYYDGLAVHYYDLTLGSLRSIRETQLANGDTTPLWLDEFGWPSCWPQRKVEQEQPCVTPQVQAANIRNVVHSIAAVPYVAAYAIYKTQDSLAEAFGLLSESGARKPSYAALAGVLRSPFGAVSPVTLRLRRSGGHVLASGSGPVGDFMQLEAFRGSTLRYRALFTLDRFNRYSLTLPAVLGTSGLRVRVFQYWSGSGRAAQASV
jgi:polysaccharide biosynthesis protein PslG